MKKSTAHRRLALAASKKGYRVQIHRNESENNCRLVAPDGSILATTLKINSSTHYDTASVVEAIGDIEQLNSARSAGNAGDWDALKSQIPACKKILQNYFGGVSGRMSGKWPRWIWKSTDGRAQGTVLWGTDWKDEASEMIIVTAPRSSNHIAKKIVDISELTSVLERACQEFSSELSRLNSAADSDDSVAADFSNISAKYSWEIAEAEKRFERSPLKDELEMILRKSGYDFEYARFQRSGGDFGVLYKTDEETGYEFYCLFDKIKDTLYNKDDVGLQLEDFYDEDGTTVIWGRYSDAIEAAEAAVKALKTYKARKRVYPPEPTNLLELILNQFRQYDSVESTGATGPDLYDVTRACETFEEEVGEWDKILVPEYDLGKAFSEEFGDTYSTMILKDGHIWAYYGDWEEISDMELNEWASENAVLLAVGL